MYNNDKLIEELKEFPYGVPSIDMPDVNLDIITIDDIMDAYNTRGYAAVVTIGVLRGVTNEN